MKKYKKRIITAVFIMACLLFVYWWGGNSPGMRGWNPKSAVETTTVTSKPEVKTESISDNKQESASVEASEEKEAEQEVPAENTQSQPTEEQQIKAEEVPATTETVSEEISVEPGIVTEELPAVIAKVAEALPVVPEQATEEVPAVTEQTAEEVAVTDKYKTDPIPEGKPAPMEPQDAVISDKAYTCTLSVRCDTVLSNIAWLSPEKAGIIPQDGVILSEREVNFFEGESVFNLLTRELRRNKIHMEFVNVPVYNSAYIEGIANLYEFDCGERSGWMYKVNGWFPNYGCSRYKLNAGDKVEWVYTCDLGDDVGGRINR